jgi:PAS domain S-box-containing protein
MTPPSKAPPKSPRAATAAAGALPREDADLQSKTASLEMELAHKNFLLQKGFEKFIETAEKLQESQRKLQLRVDELTREVEDKNRDLERARSYLSSIFASLPIGVLVTDLDGRITRVNQEGEALFQAAADDLLGTHINTLLGEVLLPAQGSGELTITPVANGDDPISFSRADGEVLKLDFSTNVMRGEQREPLGFIFNVQDVTLLKKLEEHAERQNRFTAMGEMAANIAHEIRNPLGSIELFASLLKKGLDEDEERAQMVHHISSSVASMNHIISNLLAYTKPRPVSQQRVDLHALLREITELFSFMAKQHEVEVSVALNAPRAIVLGDKEQIKQVFNNLVVNAVQSMPEGGELAVSSRALTITDPRELARFNLDDPAAAARNGFVEVTVKDTGGGIPRDIQKKIFDPFFTTKARGTGLGLAIVHQIVLSHHATIDVESREDQGTKIIMMYPCVKE